jgi:hypothetical protein
MAEEKKSNSEKLVRILSGILAVAFIIVLILVKIANPDFKLGLLLFLILLIVLLFVAIVIGFHFWQKRQKLDRTKTKDVINEKLPPAITLEQARELAKRAVENVHYADYIPHCDGETNELLGKSVKSYIYAYKSKGVYEDDMYVIVMNRHFPNETLNVLINPKQRDIERAKTLAASHPEDEPDLEVVERRNPLLGTEEVITKTSKKKDEEKEKKEEEI